MSQAIPTVAVFVASGLFHELLLLVNFGAATGEQLAFFLLHAAALLAQRAWQKRRKTPWGGIRGSWSTANKSSPAPGSRSGQGTGAARLTKGAESSPTPGQGTVSTRLTKGACLDKQIGRAQTRPLQLQGRLHASQQLPRPSWAVAMIVHAARVAVFNTFLALTLVLFFAPWFRQVPLGRFY